MNYYQFHIGDYASHTRHLGRDEDLAYRRLLDVYYLGEKPLPQDPSDCARLILMSDCSADVERVLNEFFELSDLRWCNKRADEEISKYRDKSRKAKLAGHLSAAVRKERMLNERSRGVQLTNNQEPITNNQEPRTSNQKENTGAQHPRVKTKRAICLSSPETGIPTGVDPAVFSDFLELRKVKRAPWTLTAQKVIEREAMKAGWTLNQALAECVSRGWTGFKAQWVLKDAMDAPTRSQRWQDSVQGVKQKGAELGIEWRPGVTFGQYVEQLERKQEEAR
jgi:uncharacterized protein YdaU (DUF1376 family)